MLFAAAVSVAHPTSPDWTEGAPIPPGGRANPYQLPQAELAASQNQGRIYTLHYPVSVTGLLLPYRVLRDLVEGPTTNPIQEIFRALLS